MNRYDEREGEKTWWNIDRDTFNSSLFWMGALLQATCYSQPASALPALLPKAKNDFGLSCGLWPWKGRVNWSEINFPVDQLPVDEKNFQLMKKISSWSGRCAASRNHEKVNLLFFIFKLQTNSQQQNLLSEELPPAFWHQLSALSRFEAVF